MQDPLNASERIDIDDVLIESGRPTLARDAGSNNTNGRPVDTAFRGAWCEFTSSSPITLDAGFHCVGPTINQFDGGDLFIDTSGGPLSLFYTEPATTDLRFGPNTVSSNPENFIYLSRDPANLAHVACSRDRE